MNDQTEYCNAIDLLRDDAIFICELIARLWEKRGHAAFLPLICTGLSGTELLAAKSPNNEKLSYHVELTTYKMRLIPTSGVFTPKCSESTC